MQQRGRRAETCENSFFNREYLASIEQAYADWLEPSALNDALHAELVVEAGRITHIQNLVKPWSKKTIIIKTHGLNADQVYTLFENQLVHIISSTAANRRENREREQSVAIEN